VFILQTVQFDLVGLMLGLLLQTTGPRGQFVLLLSGFGSHVEWQLAHRRHVVYDAAQFVQLLADGVQLLRIWGEIVAVALPSLSTVL
jgi:hypothetical protein